VKRKLHELAHARAGDKGDTLTLALIAYREEDYELLRAKVTAKAVKQHLGGIDLPDLQSFRLGTRIGDSLADPETGALGGLVDRRDHRSAGGIRVEDEGPFGINRIGRRGIARLRLEEAQDRPSRQPD